MNNEIKNKIYSKICGMVWDKIYNKIGRMRRYRGLGVPVKTIAEIFGCSWSYVYRETR